MSQPLRPEFNREYIFGLLNDFLATPSPSGYCMEIMKQIREETAKLGFELEMTPKGNAIITIPGDDSSNEVIALTAHVDTLGAMVRSIKPTGMIRFTPIGGYSMHSVEGEYCRIHTRDGRTYEGTVLSTKPSVHVYSDVRDWKREEANMEIRIDESVKTKEVTENLGISVATEAPISRRKLLS
jgi:putative aminopeptidase FrvX